MPQTDILSAIRQIAAERKIDFEKIVEAVKKGVKSGFEDRGTLMDEQEGYIDVDFDPDEGFIAVYANKTVVDTVSDSKREITLADAKKINPKIKLGEKVKIDVTAEGDFGRIAAQSARQVILQELREAEKAAVIAQYEDKVGSIISVLVQRILPEGDVLCEINKARVIMPKADRIPFEFLKLGSPIKALLKEIVEDQRGKYMVVSRADNKFLEELFKIEVPEIESGSVEIMSIARDPGSRSKVAVRSNSQGIDPIGSCIGQKGVRINAITNELRSGDHEEKIDIILWDEDVEQFLMNSISPAEAINVEIINEKAQKAVITVPDEKFSLAIGRDGQNARLATKLTGWEIDIKSETGIEDKPATQDEDKDEGKGEDVVEGEDKAESEEVKG